MAIESDTSTGESSSGDADEHRAEAERELTAELVARGLGNGSASREADYGDNNNVVLPNDGRSRTQTTFFPKDVGSSGPSQKHRPHHERISWKELADWNDGKRDPSRGKRNHAANRRRDAEAFADGIGLSNPEQKRVVDIIDGTDVRTFGIPRTPTIEKVLVAVCTLVRDNRCHDESDRIVGTNPFVELATVAELTPRELRRLRKSFLEKTEHFESERVDRFDVPDYDIDTEQAAAD